MIQFKRGTKKSWNKSKKPLAAGQPGYDKDSHKIKVGDGKAMWSELPYASGLSSEDILSSEKEAKIRRSAAKGLFPLNPLAALLDSPAVITYGEESPDKDTVGQLYLQCYDADPETDYIVSSGKNGIWTYQKWHSGIAQCYGTFELKTSVRTPIESASLFHNDKDMLTKEYPFSFVDDPAPHEIATLQNPGSVAWLASTAQNTKKHSGKYTVLSVDEQSNEATYRITLNVTGFWK